MTICGQTWSPQILQRIQRTVDTEPGLSRRALSRRVCEWLNWRSPLGKLREVSCRVALLKLHRRGKLELPAAKPAVISRRVRPLPAPAPEAVPPETPLSVLQPVSLVRIDSADSAASRTWNALMNGYHYLGAGPLCGAQIRYLIRSGTGEWLGGLAFSAAAWQVDPRDRWIGWSSEARRQHLHRVIANSRFLILPRWRVPHLASHVLGLALRQVCRDWQQRYGYEPVLVETFVETQRFKGTCYRAANWIEVGETRGRGRQDREHASTEPVKRVLLYPLQERAREELGGGPAAPASAPSDWAEEEFGGVALGDKRLKERLLILARDFYARPQANVPQACQTRARTKAAYRFLEHAETSMDVLLKAHYEATTQRVGREKLVLAVQDTTSLNYSTHPATEKLGPIGSSEEGIVGLVLHSTMAFDEEGTPLGLLDVQCWARDAATFGKRHKRKELPIEEKESFKWLKSFRSVAEAQQRTPGTRLVSVGDRESDIYELFHEAMADPQGPGLLVRAERDRLVVEGQEHLWPRVAQQPAVGIQEIRVPRQGSRRARQARLEVRFAQMTLKPPKLKPQFAPLTLWAVLAREVDPPPGNKPLCWMLLTTCAVESFEAACERLRWYTLRWGIEVYHRTLKSGCQIEQRQLGSADRIEACLAVDLVIGWRIYRLCKLGREIPNVPCTVYFEEAEWKALVAYVTHNPTPPEEPPTLREAVRMVASIGGFLGRKSDGEPGTKTLWLGLQELETMTAMWKILTQSAHPPPVSSRRYG
jgi:Druantia protein DruA/Transposase Tn5 dimerisation domain/Transposase DNA-binding